MTGTYGRGPGLAFTPWHDRHDHPADGPGGAGPGDGERASRRGRVRALRAAGGAPGSARRAVLLAAGLRLRARRAHLAGALAGAVHFVRSDTGRRAAGCAPGSHAPPPPHAALADLGDRAARDSRLDMGGPEMAPQPPPHSRSTPA